MPRYETRLQGRNPPFSPQFVSSPYMASDSGLSLLANVAVRVAFKGGNLDNTQSGELLSHSASPVTLCLKSGDFSLFYAHFKSNEILK